MLSCPNSLLNFISCLLVLLLSSKHIAVTLNTPVVAYECNIMDLGLNTLDIITAMAGYWTINGLSNPPFPKVYDFTGTLVVGPVTGFTTSDYIERMYTGLAGHDIIYYSIRILAVNGWQAGDTIDIQLDGTVVATFTPASAASAEFMAFYGDASLDDLSVFIVGKFYHTTPTLTLRITSHITSGSTTAAFGTRGIRMSFGHRKSTDVEGMCVRMNYRANPYNCLCESAYTEYPLGSGTCVACAARVVQCYGPGADQGYGCVPSYSYDGNSCVPCSTGCSNCLGSNVNVCLLCTAPYILNWDYTCSMTCTAYPRQENGFNFCDICQQGFYRYPNNTCLATCTAPRVQRVQVGSIFCDSPCTDPSSYYYSDAGECKVGCQYPYAVQDSVYCVLDIPQDQLAQAQTFAAGVGVSSQITGAISGVAGAFSSGNPAAFCITTLSQMLRYIRYMNITYSPKLQYILDQDPGSLFDPIPPMSQGMIDALPSNTLPARFQKYQLPSCFLINFWEPGITIVAILLFGLIVSPLLGLLFKKSKFLSSIFRSIKETVKWNYCLMYTISLIENVVMPTSFELRTASFDTKLAIVSFTVCILVNIVMLGVFIRMGSVIWTLYKAKKNNGAVSVRSDKLKEVKKGLKHYEVLFEECKDKSLLELAFMCFFIFKVYSFYMIIAYLFDYPRVQTVLITLLSIFMVLYLIILRPLKKVLILCQYIVQEILILVVNACTLILSCLDIVRPDDVETRSVLGEIIIACNLAFGAFGVLCLLISLGATMYAVCKGILQWHYNRKTGKVKPKDANSADSEFTAKNVKNSVEISPDESSITPSIFVSTVDLRTNKTIPLDTSVNLGLIFGSNDSPVKTHRRNKIWAGDLDISIPDHVADYQFHNPCIRSKMLSHRDLVQRNNVITFNKYEPSKKRKLNKVQPHRQSARPDNSSSQREAKEQTQFLQGSVPKSPLNLSVNTEMEFANS